MFDHQARRCAIGIVEHNPAGWDHRLTSVHLRHPQTASLESRCYVRDDCRILRQRTGERGGDNFARQVIIGRAETSGQNHKIGS